MLAQALNIPKKFSKSRISNEVYSVFVNSLCTSSTCTIFRDSISGFGYYKFNAEELEYMKFISISIAYALGCVSESGFAN